MPLSPGVDPKDFNPGYVMRGGHLLPKQGNKPEWRHSHDYEVDKETLAAGRSSTGEQPPHGPRASRKGAPESAPVLIVNPI
jgi:hypothetical protein